MLLLTHPFGRRSSVGCGSHDERAGRFARIAIRWLAFAAAPTFGIMALLTGLTDGGEMICSSVHGGLPGNGMPAMYLMMGLFHLAPWLRLISDGHLPDRSTVKVACSA
jgi:hypothetical protein